ncbi:SPG7 matrix AAA peptidase subunit, paraplegin [Bombus vancouverensis nearcticus]|uniref:SPG7 matrix AAA peptidase subunit, paraplegin n=1 Tax=Bombus vancouverensis nearcticus TaxID=2705178 RepID=UPI00143A0E1C|nr:paraplegin-like [Bombus vancouverensis nearcticus]
MQSSIIYSERQYVVSRKLLGYLFKYNLKKHNVFNIISRNISFNNRRNGLCFLLSHQSYRTKHTGLSGTKLLLSKNESFRIYFSKLCNARSFSTSSSNHQRSSNESDNSNKDSKKSELNMLLLKFALMILICALYYLIMSGIFDTIIMGMDWDDFINEVLLKGQVQEIRIYPDDVQATVRTGATYKGRILFKRLTFYNAPDDVEAKIRAIEKRIGIKSEDGISIRYVHMNEEMAITEIIKILLTIGFFFIFFRNPIIKKQFTSFSFLKRAKYTLVEPFSGKGVRFKDVAGLKEAKIEVMEFVDYLKNPERYTKLGAKVPKGALLLGPPGCGKTLLAKAVATESNVPFLSMNGSEFTEVIGGLGAARVRDLFAEAKRRAPSIIYIDEIDAIGKKREDSYSESANSESERTLNQLLVEMDGMIEAKDIIILASTNRAEVLDRALLRCGRFDRHILIDLPTLEERKDIFDYHLQSLSLEGTPMKYAKYLAHLTPGFSGAEIANVCNEAALHAANEKKVKIDNNDLMYAIDKVLGGSVKKSSTLTPPEKEVIVYHEAGHAVAAWMLEYANPLIKITVVPRTNKQLGFSQYFDSNLKLLSSKHLFERMCVLLGGRVAENIMFNKISTGAQNDLQKVTDMAYLQVQQFGMSPSVGLLSFDKELTSTKTKKPYSKKLGSLMDAEVRRIIVEAYKTTEKLLQDNKDKLITLAEELLKKETLTYKDIEALIGPPPFGKKNIAELEEYNSGVE